MSQVILSFPSHFQVDVPTFVTKLDGAFILGLIHFVPNRYYIDGLVAYPSRCKASRDYSLDLESIYDLNGY